MAQALKNPSPLARIVGQDHARSVLEAVLRAGDFPPLLFSGPAGTGKRTAALEFCRAANCANPDRAPCGECNPCRTIAKLTHPDLKVVFPMARPKKKAHEDEEEDVANVVQAALEKSEEYRLGKAQPVPDNRHRVLIELARWLRHEMTRPPFSARLRVFVVLHCHRLTQEAGNALLKTLEEPQSQTTLILTTDNLEGVLDTIRSRCRLVRFGELDRNTVKNWLVENAGATPEDAAIAAEVGDGSLGRALGFVSQPSDFLPEPVLALFGQKEPGHEQVLAASDALRGFPPGDLVRALLFLYRQVLLARQGRTTAYSRANPAVAHKARLVSDDYLVRALRFLAGRLADSRLNVNPRLFNYTLLAALRKTQ